MACVEQSFPERFGQGSQMESVSDYALTGSVIAGDRAAALLGENLGDRRGQRRLPVVDVTDRADVQVRLRALELLLGHAGSLLL